MNEPTISKFPPILSKRGAGEREAKVTAVLSVTARRMGGDNSVATPPICPLPPPPQPGQHPPNKKLMETNLMVGCFDSSLTLAMI